MAVVVDKSEVLSSAEFVVSKAENVSISANGVMHAVDFIIGELFTEGKCNMKEKSQFDEFEPEGFSEEEILEWLFLQDTLNFCFWSDSEEDLYTVEYRGKSWTGYRSMCAALCRAVENGIPIHKPSFYGTVTLNQLRKIFQSSNNTEIPQLRERQEALHEASHVLHKMFGGKVVNLVERSCESAQSLVNLLAENFTSYCDVSSYKGQRVAFLKRAQIFVADVWSRFGGKGYGKFEDIDTLTMFADYRVPQCLVYLGVLKYDSALMKTLNEGVHVEKDSNYENEIRGSSIWAVELMCRELRKYLDQLPPSQRSQLGNIYPCTIDFFLWRYAKMHSEELSSIPIHRTVTIFY